MKRDLELCRKILEVIESCPNPYGIDYVSNINIPGYSPEIISYHLQILLEGGFIKAVPLKEISKYSDFISINLTWKGHDFLSLSKEKPLWEKVKKSVIDNGKAFTVDLLLFCLKEMAKESLKRVLNLEHN